MSLEITGPNLRIKDDMIPESSSATLHPYCGGCFHFKNDPITLEEAFKGFASLSSGFGSVKSYDGLCDWHGVYLSFKDVCEDFKGG
jgi:hypothetical protein